MKTTQHSSKLMILRRGLFLVAALVLIFGFGESAIEGLSSAPLTCDYFR